MSKTINTGQYTQIFTDNLNDAYGVIDDAWLTIAVEGFDNYGELVSLYRDETDELTFGSVENNEFYFQNLDSHDNRLIDSLGFHLNAYNLELPEYIEGEINLYAGKGTYPYGEVYESYVEFDMNWEYSNYTVDIDMFNAQEYNSQNFLLTTLPITSQDAFVEGELYLHHRIDLSDSNNIITSGLPDGVEFAVVVPSETSRISSISISSIDQVSAPWDWVESWQGFSLTQDDYITYNEDNADTYNPSTQILTQGIHFDFVLTDEGVNQIHFFENKDDIISLLYSDIIQLDFHINYEFSEFDYTISEEANTYNVELHWNFPVPSYLFWNQFEYHPDLTSTTSFFASYYHLSEYAPIVDYKSTYTETFQFYPNEYNFTTFEFTGFEDKYFEVTLNLTHGGEFQERWEDIKPFGMTVQTESGERYLDSKYFFSWNHDNETYPNDPIFTFRLAEYIFDYLGMINDTEILVTYYYRKESLSYYTRYDNILYGAGYELIIKDSEGNHIFNIGNISSIQGNNITFTENIKNLLDIGENFTITYDFKTIGGLLDTKHMFIEVQPYEMKFYNNYYPFSGASIVAPLYYNLSANYQYQLALNYRLQEKGVLSFTYELTDTDISSDSCTIDLDQNTPLMIGDSAAIIAYYYDENNQERSIHDHHIEYENGIVTISYLGTGYQLTDDDILYISIFPELHNKYQPFHDLVLDLTTNEAVLTNWTVAQDPENNLIANFESQHAIFDANKYDAFSKGYVKEIFAILNSSNSLTYYLTEDLNDPVEGWTNYETLIMKLGILNPDVLSYIDVSFYYENSGSQLIGSVNITVDMIDVDTGTVYIPLPDPGSFNQFTVLNNASVVFTPIFYDHTDFLGYFYQDGFPTYQTVVWEEEKVKYGFLNIDLDKKLVDILESVLVFNEEFEFVYEITDIDTRVEIYDETYELEFHNISIPNSYMIDEKSFVMNDGDILFLKYNAAINKSIGIAVEDMALQKAPYIENYFTEQNDVPIAEISLLGVNNDGDSYTIDDIYANRDELVAWEGPLDTTPFENILYNNYRQHVINISFTDIYSDFKVSDENGIDHCYITDILITSNDPRYELVIDSIFLFEFDENATLYDSEIFDIYPNNHVEKFYVGEYTDIYSEVITLNASSFLPLYQDDHSINETHYFDAFDNYGNWYYFGEHLIGHNTSDGIYDITWNPDYSEEYYFAYIDQDEDLQDLYDYYNPHIDLFRYLYISWADQDAWKEWQTIDQVNINSSTLDITFEWYDDVLEEYQSVTYNQSLGEFEARHIAIETIWPYDTHVATSANFSLSQDYSSAQDLDIMMIKGYFFNESSIDFDPDEAIIYPSEKLLEISPVNGYYFDDFEKIIVYINFTGGAYSDYTQFRLLQAAINNYPEAPEWTKNDSLYVDFEYTDIDYFLLMEDYAVGSEDSLFELLDYVRNDDFVRLDAINNEYLFDTLNQGLDFENFTRVNDLTTVLEFHDFDLDASHELVLQKDSLNGDGIYNSFKYGYINSAGEISFNKLVQEAHSTQINKEKDSDTSISEGYQLKWKDIYRKYYIFVERTLETTTTKINRIEKFNKIIQEDLDSDGLVDREISFEWIFSTTEVITYTQETTHLHFKPTVNNLNGKSHDGYLHELRNSSYIITSDSISFMITDFENNEVESVRLYVDNFPNEISENYNVENNLIPVVNDNNDEDPDNDITVYAPSLEGLLTLSHIEDGISGLYETKITFEDGELSTYNILAVNKTLPISGLYNDISGLDEEFIEKEIMVPVIEVVPQQGVYYDLRPGSNPDKVQGSYYYFDEDNDGVCSTIFVADEKDNIIAIVIDYDQDSIVNPAKRELVTRHIIENDVSGWEKGGDYVADNYIDQELIYFKDYDHFDGDLLEITFCDSIFDIWKMQYSRGTSELIKDVMSMTSHQFIQSVSGRVVDDIWWQLEAQMYGITTGIIIGGILAAIATYTTWGVGALPAFKGGYMLGHFLGYGIANSIHSYIQERDQGYWIKSQTFHNEDYEGEVTLSNKLIKDRYWGGEEFIPDALWGSGRGVYAPVKVETDKYTYEGKVILAPAGESKTDFNIWDLDVSYKAKLLDYSQQTRSYLMYSDWGDELDAFFFDTKKTFHTNTYTYKKIPIDSEFTYMPNSIMYLEHQISTATKLNEDDNYDSIIPYMVYGAGTFVPTFQFADSQGSNPIPEFYEEYPIYTSPENYYKLREDSYSVYKLYDPETNIVQLFPEDSSHLINSNITHIDIYCIDPSRETTEISGKSIIIKVYRQKYYDITHFTFHRNNGTVILDSERMGFFNAVINSFKADNPENEPYIILEFHIEKYRSVSYQGFVSEENSRIALMQAAHASILEYMYQHSIATKTQKKLSQAAYTTFITFVSVMVSMVPITIGSSIGSAAASIAKAGTAAATTTVSTLAKAWCIAKSVAVHVAKLVKVVAFEILEELYLDPWIEATVSTYMAESGADLLTKAFATSFAESIRETLMGGVASAFRTAISNIINIKTEVGVDTATSTSQDIQDQISEMNEALQAQEEAREKRRILFQVAASTLALLTAPFGGMAFASIGYSVGTSVYGTYRTIKMAKEVKTGTNNILLNAYLNDFIKRQLRQVHPLPIHVESDMEQSQFEFGVLPGWDDPIADDEKFDWFSDIEEDVMDGATSMLAEEEIIIPSVMETHMTGWGMGAGILGNLRMPSIHLSHREGSGNERPTVIRNSRLPQYLSNNVFMSILKEVSNYMNKESEAILRDTEGLTEQEALQYVTRSVMQYLHNEKADLMNTLSRQDESKANKIAPKVAIYTSVIYLLKFTDKLVNQIDRAISGVKHHYIKFVRDYFRLTTPERFTYNIKNIESMLDSIHYELVSPLTQREFDLLEGDSAFKRIKIKCTKDHEYFTIPSNIKNLMLKGEGLCQKCYHKSRIVYTFDNVFQEVGDREDELIFPKTKEDWDLMEGSPSDRKITVKCGVCGEERECMARIYFKYERCPSCFHIESSLSYENVRDRGLNEGFRLKTPKVEFNKIKASHALDATTTWQKEDLEWKCLDCEEIVKITFQSIKDTRTGCPSCKMTKHQKYVHKYIEQAFDTPFESEKRLGDIDLDEVGVSPSSFLFSPNLRFDGYAIVRIPGYSPIPVLFEARGYQYWHWPSHFFKETNEGLLSFLHYRKNADQKDRFAQEHKIVLISIYDNWNAELVRSEFIRQFKLKTRVYGYSEEGITLDPPYYGKDVFLRKFLGSL